MISDTALGISAAAGHLRHLGYRPRLPAPRDRHRSRCARRQDQGSPARLPLPPPTLRRRQAGPVFGRGKRPVVRQTRDPPLPDMRRHAVRLVCRIFARVRLHQLALQRMSGRLHRIYDRRKTPSLAQPEAPARARRVDLGVASLPRTPGSMRSTLALHHRPMMRNPTHDADHCQARPQTNCRLLPSG